MHHIRMTNKKNHMITIIDTEKRPSNSIGISDLKK